MAKQDFIPVRDGDLLSWHDNFKNQVATLAAKYGLAAAQVAAIATDNAELRTDFADADAKAAASLAATAKKKETKAVKIANVRAVTRQIKANPAYTTADGQLLGVEGAEDSTDLSQSQPTLKLTSVAVGAVTLSFNKSGSDGVRISSKRGAETAFTFLATDTSSPYLDSRPNLTPGPETRHYQAQYLLSDETVGLLSDVLVVTVPG